MLSAPDRLQRYSWHSALLFTAAQCNLKSEEASSKAAAAPEGRSHNLWVHVHAAKGRGEAGITFTSDMEAMSEETCGAVRIDDSTGIACMRRK